MDLTTLKLLKALEEEEEMSVCLFSTSVSSAFSPPSCSGHGTGSRVHQLSLVPAREGLWLCLADFSGKPKQLEFAAGLFLKC